MAGTPSEALELPGKSVNLNEVKDLSDEEYEGLLGYARQWDSPNQDSWIEQIESARGSKSSKSAASGDEVPEGTIQEVLDWVGDDPDRAQQALDAENEYDDPRSTLVEKLEGMVG